MPEGSQSSPSTLLHGLAWWITHSPADRPALSDAVVVFEDGSPVGVLDAAPEGGCAFAVLRQLVRAGRVDSNAEVVVFNTGSGSSYRN